MTEDTACEDCGTARAQYPYRYCADCLKWFYEFGEIRVMRDDVDMTRMHVTAKLRPEPRAFERLRRYAIEQSPTNVITAATYGMSQIMLAGGSPYDTYPLAQWYGRALGVHRVSDTDVLNLWDEVRGA